MKKEKVNFLSVIVPAYKQEGTIKKDLLRIKSVLDKIRYDYELICVADGKEDDTYKNARSVRSSKINVVGYKNNRGKGYAVRYGMARAKGNYIAFIDSGMDIDPNGISMIIEHMEWYDADIIVGSKRHPASQVEYPLLRKIYSIGYQIGLKILFGLNIKDTQAGLKIFKREVLVDVLPRLLVKRFAFDIELLAVANKLGYKKIFEAPIKVDPERFVFSSTVKTRTILEVLVDTLAVYYRLVILRYYDNRSKRMWKYDPELDYKINTGEYESKS